MKGEITLIDNIDCGNYEFSVLPSAHDFSLSIYVDKDHTLESQLKNKTGFRKCIEEMIEIRNVIGSITPEEEQEIKYIEDNFENLLDSVEYIYFSFEEQSVKDYIKENPIVLTKKIVIDVRLEITDYDKLIELMREYEDIIDKVYVNFSGNDNYVSLKDCYKTMNIIKKQADSIKSLGMSPMEEIMYVYDQVRNRVYTFENSDETCFKSRDLTEVLVGDKIVCAGYANIFSTLLGYLGIKNYKVYLREKNKDSAHARNVIYVKDPKYNLDGVYYFDPTWDSKKKENDNSYLYRYRYFAKTREYMDNDKHYDFEDVGSPLYSKDLYSKLKEIIDSGEYEKLMDYSKTITHMGNIVGEKNLISPHYIYKDSPFFGQFDTKTFLKRFKRVVKKFDKEIPAETMLELLNNVRKIEYYQDSDWYLYSISDIYRTMIESNWTFKENHLSEQERFLAVILGQKKQDKKDPKSNYTAYGHEKELFKNIEQVRLAKVLQKTLQKNL